MNFRQAVEAMKQGNKVRRESWTDKSQYMVIGEDNFFWSCNSKMHISVKVAVAEDWEIVEENKTLSDKIQMFPEKFDIITKTRDVGTTTEDEKIFKKIEVSKLIPILFKEDVKEALKEFIVWLENLDGISLTPLNTKTKEIFGEDLI